MDLRPRDSVWLLGAYPLPYILIPDEWRLIAARVRAVAARGDEKGARATIASYGAVWRFGP